MSQQIAVGECSTEEDLGIEWVFASGYDPAGKALEVAVRERSTATLKTTLTVGSGLTIVGASVKAKVSKATMSAWARTEYTADLVDKTGGAPRRLVPTRIIFDEPGKLVGGVSGNSFRVTQAENRFVVTATTGETGPVGPATTLTIGAVTDVAPGSSPTANLTGPAGAQVLSLGLVRGLPGAGAPTSADILALADRDDLLREIAGAGVPDRPIAIFDFVRGVHWVKGAYSGASIAALAAAVPGSTQGRASTATYFDSDGLLKTAAVGVARIDYDPVTRVCRGFLRDPVKTNLLTWSEDLTQASWQKIGATVTPNNVVGPDGLMTMGTLVQDTSTGLHAVQVTISLDAAQQLTYSQVVKAMGWSKGRIQINALSGNRIEAIFDLAAGTISATAVGTASGAKANIQPLGNSLYRLSVAGQAAAATTANLQVGIVLLDASNSQSFTGEGASGIAMGCGQVEIGGLSSYIPTAASTVARAIESLQIGTEPWLNLAEGTIFVEFEAVQPPTSTNDFAFNMGTGGLSDFIAVYRSSAGSGPGYVRSISGSVSQISTTANMPWPSTPAARAAVGWKAGDAAWGWEGAIAGSSNTYVVPLTMPRVLISTSAVINSSWIKRILIYPRRLSNAKLQAITNQSLWS